MNPVRFLAALTCVGMVACGGGAAQDDDMASTPAAAAAPELQPAAPATGAFEKTVRFDDVVITVSSPNRADPNDFTVTTTGLTASNMAGERFDIAGTVTDVLIDDIDGDNSPEFFVIARPAAGGLASVRAFSTFGRRSWGLIDFPDQSVNSDVTSVFRDGDEYMPVENTFVMRFPIYEGGTNTGKTRQLQFKLRPGEAMKQLVLDRQTDY